MVLEQAYTEESHISEAVRYFYMELDTRRTSGSLYGLEFDSISSEDNDVYRALHRLYHLRLCFKERHAKGFFLRVSVGYATYLSFFVYSGGHRGFELAYVPVLINGFVV